MNEISVKSRKTGTSHNMAIQIMNTIKAGEKARVAGCLNPKGILNRLSNLGVKAIAEPMTRTINSKPIFDEYGEIIGLTDSEVIQTGYCFSLSDSKLKANES